MVMTTQSHTLAVDLDGTLTPTDTLHESIARLFRQRPLAAWRLPFWLRFGKAGLKSRIAEEIQLDASTLPYNQQLLRWLQEEKRKGRSIALCTASDGRVARQIAEHLGLFDEVLASDGSVNNSRENKRAALESRFGERGFDYVGNSSADLDVWRGARSGIIVNASASVQRRAEAIVNVERVFPRETIGLMTWVRVFRLHQWVKNLLLFVPLLAAHRFDDLHALGLLLLAFLSFGACASSVYITNDLLDLDSDRKHPHKRNRPFASAAVPIAYGMFLFPLALAISAAIGWFVGWGFLAWLAVYYVLTSVYSLVLKRHALMDCLTLAGLYTLRVIAGAAAVQVPLSFWLLAFSTFIFLSLAFAKRYTELQVQAAHGIAQPHGRGYNSSDAPLIQMFGITAGYLSVLVLALYLQGETVASLYATPELIWGAVPLMLFWVSRVWLKAHRGEMHDDPVVFALKDRVSLIIAGAIGACFLLATSLG